MRSSRAAHNVQTGLCRVTGKGSVTGTQTTNGMASGSAFRPSQTLNMKLIFTYTQFRLWPEDFPWTGVLPNQRLLLPHQGLLSNQRHQLTWGIAQPAAVPSRRLLAVQGLLHKMELCLTQTFVPCWSFTLLTNQGFTQPRLGPVWSPVWSPAGSLSSCLLPKKGSFLNLLQTQYNIV